MHSFTLGGYLGFSVNHGHIKQLFAWRGMKADDHSFVVSYSICLHAKLDHVRYPGLLSSLTVPTDSWQITNMDFIDGLPQLGFANCIMVVVA